MACQLCPRHQYHTMPSFSWNQSPVSTSSSQPSFARFFPTDTRVAQFWRAGTAAKARWREKALKNHFMKHPCSRRPSHKAQAADFPLATHPTHRRGLGHSQPLFSPTGSPRESELTGMALESSWQQTPPLASSSAVVSLASLMQEMKDSRSLWDLCEPGDSQAKTEEGSD